MSVREDYEVEYFAKQHGITKEQTLELIKKQGGGLATLDAAAKAQES